MEEVTIIGIDLAKNVFQLHGAAADGRPVFRKKLIGAPYPLEGLLRVMRDFRFRRPIATAQGACRLTACVRPAARRAPGG